MSNWIPDFECRSCGSSMGRWSWNGNIDREDMMCFCCGAGEFELCDAELAGLDYEQAMKLAGREWGLASNILPRINTPGGCASAHITAKRALDALNLHWGVGSVDVIRRHIDIDVTATEIKAVEKVLRKMTEEK